MDECKSVSKGTDSHQELKRIICSADYVRERWFSSKPRYNLTRWISADATYGRNRVTDRYFTPGFSTVQATAHQFTGGFVAELPVFPKVRPYLLAESGAILFDPTGSQAISVAGAQKQAAGTFVYGGGIDYSLFRYLALRAEYRGLVYDSPDFNLRALNANAVTHTAEPSAGIVLHF